MIISNLLITIGAWFILAFFSTNLLGLFVRGLFSYSEINRLESEGNELIKNEIKKHKRADSRINIVAFILIIGYLCLLFYFWNIGIMTAAIMLMAGRLPDLIWEIKHGKKIDTKSIPRDTIFYITTLLDWVALPVIYYSIFIL